MFYFICSLIFLFLCAITKLMWNIFKELLSQNKELMEKVMSVNNTLEDYRVTKEKVINKSVKPKIPPEIMESIIAEEESR